MRVSYIVPEEVYTPCGMYEFEKTITLEAQETYRIRIYTSGRYLLKINGQYICEGPCRGHEDVRYYDAVETDALHPGENEISITVQHLNDGRRFTTVFQTAKPELIFEAKSEKNRIVSDASWSCTRDDRYKLVDKCRFLSPDRKSVV